MMCSVAKEALTSILPCHIPADGLFGNFWLADCVRQHVGLITTMWCRMHSWKKARVQWSKLGEVLYLSATMENASYSQLHLLSLSAPQLTLWGHIICAEDASLICISCPRQTQILSWGRYGRVTCSWSRGMVVYPSICSWRLVPRRYAHCRLNSRQTW
jgi:hypothetical protein